MLHKLKQQKSDGFTIIEVLIVLAIAGLIMMVVFLAVPALQRNSHNTERKSDVSALIGAVQEYENNNNGSLPTAAADITGLAKTGFYQSTDIVYAKNGSAVTATPTATDKVTINTYSKCNGNALAASGATSRNVTAVYFIETSGAPQAQCQDI